MPEQKSSKAVKSATRSSGTGWQSAMKSKPAPQVNVTISTKSRRRPKTKSSAVHPDTTTTGSQNSDDTGGAYVEVNNKKTATKKKVMTIVRKTAGGEVKRSSLKLNAPNLASLQRAASGTPSKAGSDKAAASSTAAEDGAAAATNNKPKEKSVALADARAAAAKKKKQASHELLDDDGNLIGVSETWKNPFGGGGGATSVPAKKKKAMKKKPPQQTATATSTTTSTSAPLTAPPARRPGAAPKPAGPTDKKPSTTSSSAAAGGRTPPRRPGAKRTGPPDKKLSAASSNSATRSTPPPPAARPRRPGAKRVGPPDKKVSTSSTTSTRTPPPPPRIGGSTKPPKSSSPLPPKRVATATKKTEPPKAIARPKQSKPTIATSDTPSSTTTTDDVKATTKSIDEKSEPAITTKPTTTVTEKEEEKEKKSSSSSKPKFTSISSYRDKEKEDKGLSLKQADKKEEEEVVTTTTTEPSKPKMKFKGLSKLKRDSAKLEETAKPSTSTPSQEPPPAEKPKMKFKGLSKLRKETEQQTSTTAAATTTKDESPDTTDVVKSTKLSPKRVPMNDTTEKVQPKKVPMPPPENDDNNDSKILATPGTPGRSKKIGKLAAMFEKGNSSVPSALNASMSSFGKSPIPAYSRSSFVSPGTASKSGGSSSRLPAVRPPSSPKKYTSMPRTWKPKPKPQEVISSPPEVADELKEKLEKEEVKEQGPPVSEISEPAKPSMVEEPSTETKEPQIESKRDTADDDAYAPRTPSKSKRHLQIAAMFEKGNSSSSSLGQSPRARMPAVRPSTSPKKYASIPRTWKPKEKKVEPEIKSVDDEAVKKPTAEVVEEPTKSAESTRNEGPSQLSRRSSSSALIPETVVEAEKETESPVPVSPKPAAQPTATVSLTREEASSKAKDEIMSPSAKGISQIASVFDKNPSQGQRNFANPRQRRPVAEEVGDGTLMSMEEVEAMIKASAGSGASATPEPERKTEKTEDVTESEPVPPDESVPSEKVEEPQADETPPEKEKDQPTLSNEDEEVDPIALLLDEFNEPEKEEPIETAHPNDEDDDVTEITELRDTQPKSADASIDKAMSVDTSSYEKASSESDFEAESDDDEAQKQVDIDKPNATVVEKKQPDSDKPSPSVEEDEEKPESEKPKPKMAMKSAWSILKKGGGSSSSSDSSNTSSSGDSSKSVDAGPTDDDLEFEDEEVNKDTAPLLQTDDVESSKDEKVDEPGAGDIDVGGALGAEEGGEAVVVLEFAIPGEDNRHVPVHAESMDDMSSLGSFGLIESDDSYDTRMNKMLKKLMGDKVTTDDDDSDDDEDMADGAASDKEDAKDAGDEDQHLQLDDNVLDHVILAGPDFEEAVKLFEETTGIEPTIVGPLQGLGVASAQVIMDNNRYISILGPDPDPDAAGPIGDELVNLEWGQLTPYHYAIRSSEMSRLVEGYVSDVLGWTPDNVAMVQSLSDESVRKWDLLTMYGHEIGGAAPCYVKWKKPSHHPTAGTPQAVTLLYFVVAVPENHDVNKLVSEVDGITVEQDETPRMELYLETPNGMVDFSTEHPPGYAFPGFYDYYRDVPEMVEEETGDQDGYDAGEDAGGEGENYEGYENYDGAVYDGDEYQGYYGEDGIWYQWDGEGGYYGEDGQYYPAEEEGQEYSEKDTGGDTGVAAGVDGVDGVVDELQNLIDGL